MHKSYRATKRIGGCWKTLGVASHGRQTISKSGEEQGKKKRQRGFQGRKGSSQSRRYRSLHLGVQGAHYCSEGAGRKEGGA